MAPQAAETLSPHDCFLKPASDSIAVRTDLPKSLHPCSSGRAWVLKLLASCNYTCLQPFQVIMPTPSCSLQEARDVMAARSLDCQCCSSRVMYVMAYAVGDWKPLGASLFPMRVREWAPRGPAVSFQCRHVNERPVRRYERSFSPQPKDSQACRLPEKWVTPSLGSFRSL